MRRFVVVGQSARTARDFPLDDLCGAAGRWDLLARCVQASLFIAHDLRRDAELVLVLLGPPDAPKAVRISGDSVRNLNPDERSTVALLSRALEVPLPRNGRWVDVREGIHASKMGLEEVLDENTGSALVLLDEDGPAAGEDLPAGLKDDDATFVLGDNKGLTDEQFSLIRSRRPMEVRLGPVPLHTDHCIAIVHNILDRSSEDRI